MNIPSPRFFKKAGKDWSEWAQELVKFLAKPDTQKGVLIPSFAKGSLPAAVEVTIIFVPDESGGATLAFSDGTHFRRVQDRAIVS